MTCFETGSDIDIDIDIVIVTFNSADHLPACLAAIPDRTRVIVIDNASSDDGPNLAEAMGCRVVRNHTNLGFARAVNQALALTAAPMVLLLNPDAVLAHDTLDHLRAALVDPKVAIAGGRLLQEDGRDQQPWWPFPSAGGTWLEAFMLRRSTWKPNANTTGRDVDFVVGACLLMRRDVVRQLGGFDERFWLYGEEADLCKRVRNAGFRVQFVPEAITRHVGGASSESLGASVSTHFVRGTERFVLHHQGRLALLSHRVGALVGSALRLTAMRVTGDRRSARFQTRKALARHLLTEIRQHPFDVPVTKQDATDCIVVCSLEAWDDVWRRNQFLVRELTARPDVRTRVLFVEPPNDVVHNLRRRQPLGVLRPRLRIVAAFPGVVLFQPVKWLPRVFGGFADRSLRRQVRRAATEAGFDQPTLWVNDSAYVGFAEEGTWPVLYDITDDWTREQVSQREKKRRVDRERRLLARAGAVVVCSPELAVDRGRTRPVTLIPNAVDTDHFQRPRPRPDDLPAGPTAVYVGSIQRERFDTDLVADLARSLPHLQIVLIGPASLTGDEQQVLDAFTNMHLLGPRPYQDVPAYLQHADVVIVPHVVTPFTESLDPIKAYECLAIGRPTVSTPVAGFRDLPAPIVIADALHFVDAVRQSITTWQSSMPATNVASWATRAEAFAGELHSAAAARPRRRVVFIGHTARQSGAELALVRLVPGLPDADIQVVLAEDGPLVGLLEAGGATVTVLPMDVRTRETNRAAVQPGRLPFAAAWHAAVYTVRLAQLLREMRPDLVHTNTLKASIYGGAAARLAGVPLVWHVRDRIASDYLPATAARGIRLLSRHLPDGVIANSFSTRATLELDDTDALHRTTVVYDPLPIVPNIDRLAGDRLSGEMVVGMVGRLAPWKGQDLFLKAFATAFPTGTEQALIVGSAMFGEDDYAESLKVLALELGIAERVRFVGFVDDVWPLLARMTMLVHASTIPEPFGQVVLEGLAAGLPVIAADAGGPAEIITHNVDGLLTAPNDTAALAHAMLQLAEDPALRIRLGDAGRTRSHDFSAAAVGTQVSTFYERVLADRKH
jgi:glycosyltransferase involved in cell wall biosynthesis/GT2 family glycosyltransferase